MKKKKQIQKNDGVNNIFIFTVVEEDEVKFSGGKSLRVEKFEMGKAAFRLSDFKKALKAKFNVKNQTKTEKAIAKKIINHVIANVKKSPQIRIL